MSNELIKSPLNKDLGIVDIDSEDQSHGHSVIPNPSKEQHSSKFTESKKFETKAISQIYKPLFQVKKAQSREKKKRFGRKQDKGKPCKFIRVQIEPIFVYYLTLRITLILLRKIHPSLTILILSSNHHIKLNLIQTLIINRSL